MKRLVLIVAIIILTSALASEKDKYFKVQIDDTKQLQLLAQNSIELLDAKVYPIKNSPNEFKIKWFEEKGFVTAAGDDETERQIDSLGLKIIESGIIPPKIIGAIPTEDLPAQAGWPKTMSGWPTINGHSTTVADINNDGYKEIFLNNTEGYVYMWKYNGTYVLGYPKSPFMAFLGIDPSTGDSVFASWITTGSIETAGAGDVNGDGEREFIFGKDVGYIFAYQYFYQPPSGFPWNIGLINFTNVPTLYDVDTDGKDEIIMLTYLDDYYYPNQPAQLHIYNEDMSEPAGWPVQIPVESESSPVVGDIDNDGEVEIVVGSGRNTDQNIEGGIYAFNLDGSLCAGFPIETGYSVESTPSLYDIDMNGTLDILIRVKMVHTEINGIYAFNGQGQLLTGFPAVLTSGGSTGAPAIADMDGDGLPEIAYGTAEPVDLGKIWVFEHDGTLKDNFPQPVLATWVEESVILADVSGDGLPDVIGGTNGVSNDPARVWAFDHLGNTVNGFPITINETFSTLENTPTAADIDNDGDIELFSASREGTVFCWDTPGIPSITNDWPTFKYNAARHGGYADENIPVELISFSAEHNEEGVNLNWVTATETNNKGFAVERKFYSKWNEIGFVEGKGSTTEITKYKFTDSGISDGVYSYRLKQIDLDGTFIYSNVVEISFMKSPTEFTLMQNYPNPFNPITTIKFTIPTSSQTPLLGKERGGGEVIKLVVYDILGKEVSVLVNEQKQHGTYEVEFDASDLPSGIYFYRLNAGSFSDTKKLILLK